LKQVHLPNLIPESESDVTIVLCHPRLPLRRLLLLVLLLSAFSGGATARADEATDIIRKTGEFYASRTTLAVDVSAKLEMPPQFSTPMPPVEYKYWFRSPGSLALVPSTGGMMAPVIQDGQRFYTEVPMLGAAVLRDAMPLPSFCTEEGSEYLGAPGADMLLGLGLDAGVTGALRSRSGVTLVGDDEVDGVVCSRLAVDDPGFKGEVWVAKGDKPWVMRVHRPAPEPSFDSGQMMVRTGFDAHFANWDADPQFGDVFTIKPDQDLELRDSMPTRDEFMAKAMAQANEEFAARQDRPHPSLDKPAPDMTLKLLDGGEIALSSLKGKVVVLDFWAIWCKPCVMALPLMAAAIGDLADKGVVFYAVNQREPQAKVESFLKEKNLHVTVALDESGAAGKAFGVDAIPHSVIIDKKGLVRQVHVGYEPGMEDRVMQEIEELLAE
jgi:peroxiredoxin